VVGLRVRFAYDLKPLKAIRVELKEAGITLQALRMS